MKNKLEELADIKDLPTKFSQQRIKETKLVEDPKLADLNLELANKIIPAFEGSYKDVAPFSEKIEILHKTLKPEAKKNGKISYST